MNEKKLAVLTSGGDAPAMNAVVYSFILSAELKGYSVFGVMNGYNGLIDGDFVPLSSRDFKKNIFLSGTAIGSSRSLKFKEESVRKDAVSKLKSDGFEGLFVVGGDGSYMGAKLVSDLNFPVVAAPGTIDNDVASTKYTIGFFSALEEIFQSIKKIKSTSDSHSQITFIEVMGRDCHDLSVVAALSGGVDYVLTNKSIKTPEELCDVLKRISSSGQRGIVVLVTEKICGENFGFGLPSLPELCSFVEKNVGRQTRFNVLGYTQRGAVPSSWDLYMSQRFGIEAFKSFFSGKTGVALGFDGFNFYSTPLSKAVSMEKEFSIDLIDFVNSFHKN